MIKHFIVPIIIVIVTIVVLLVVNGKPIENKYLETNLLCRMYVNQDNPTQIAGSSSNGCWK